jgi:hypothetical protein
MYLRICEGFKSAKIIGSGNRKAANPQIATFAEGPKIK